MYCNNFLFFLRGDYNSPCSNLDDDNIRGVDGVLERDIVDITLDKYGEIMCNFLIDSN